MKKYLLYTQWDRLYRLVKKEPIWATNRLMVERHKLRLLENMYKTLKKEIRHFREDEARRLRALMEKVQS